MISIKEAAAINANVARKMLGDDVINMKEYNKVILERDLDKAEFEAAKLREEIAAIKNCIDTEEVEEQEVIPVEESVKETEVLPVEESVKETEVLPVEELVEEEKDTLEESTEKLKKLEKEIETSKKELQLAKEEAIKQEVLDLTKDKMLALLKQVQQGFSNSDILDAIEACRKIAENPDEIANLNLMGDKEIDILKDKDEVIKTINDAYELALVYLPIFGLVKFPLDIQGMINRVESIKTGEQLNAVIDILVNMIKGLDLLNDTKIALAITQHEWAKEELELLGIAQEDLQKEAKELQTAIDVEVPTNVEEGIAALMIAYPNIIKPVHNHLSPTNTVYTIQNSGTQMLTIVPLLDDNKQLTRVKIALSPIELFKDGAVIPFTFTSEHHEQEFIFNAKVMSAISAFITNNGGFRTNTNDTSIELEDVKK